MALMSPIRPPKCTDHECDLIKKHGCWGPFWGCPRYQSHGCLCTADWTSHVISQTEKKLKNAKRKLEAAKRKAATKPEVIDLDPPTEDEAPRPLRRLKRMSKEPSTKYIDFVLY